MWMCEVVMDKAGKTPKIDPDPNSVISESTPEGRARPALSKVVWNRPESPGVVRSSPVVKVIRYPNNGLL